MQAVMDVWDGLVKKSEAVLSEKQKYMAGDGLYHCSVCGEPLQCRIEIFGRVDTVGCICGCDRQAEAEYRKRMQEDSIERARRTCFHGTEMIHWDFSRDDMRTPELTGEMRRYADEFRRHFERGEGLLLFGDVDTGKTFYAACIANAVLDSGRTALLTKFTALVNRMQGEAGERQKLTESLNRFDLIVFDDLGAERSSEYMQEQVFHIIDERCRSGLPFIVTTNLPIRELITPADVGKQRIYTRIMERCRPIAVNGVHRRKEHMKQLNA